MTTPTTWTTTTAAPSTSSPVSDLWKRLCGEPRPSVLIDFPRLAFDGTLLGQLRMRVLTAEEQLACTKAAEDFARRMMKDAPEDGLGYETFYANALVIEILFRACRDAIDEKRPAFPVPSELRRTVTMPDCHRLFEQYVAVQDALSTNDDNEETDPE